MQKQSHNEQWFLDRIGHRVFRDAGSCECSECKDVIENGIVVVDEDHALYLHEIANEWACEGVFLNYRDVK